MGSPGPFLAASSSMEANSLFKQVLDNLLDGVYFTDRERRITYWNQAAEYLTGYSAEEVIGKRCSDNFLMHVDDSGCLLCGGDRPLSHTIADGRPRRAEVYFRPPCTRSRQQARMSRPSALRATTTATALRRLQGSYGEC